MKPFIVALALSMATAASAQTPHAGGNRRGVEMTSRYGASDTDLQSILYFEDIGLEKIRFTGAPLDGRDYVVSIAYFRIRGDELALRVLSKATPGRSAKIELQFNGFSKRILFDLSAQEDEFVLKNFLGSRSSAPIDLDAENVLLAYMMPYVKADGSKQYCDVVQSQVKPEDMGTAFKIPRYFLIKIKFLQAAG